VSLPDRFGFIELETAIAAIRDELYNQWFLEELGEHFEAVTPETLLVHQHNDLGSRLEDAHFTLMDLAIVSPANGGETVKGVGGCEHESRLGQVDLDLVGDLTARLLECGGVLGAVDECVVVLAMSFECSTQIATFLDDICLRCSNLIVTSGVQGVTIDVQTDFQGKAEEGDLSDFESCLSMLVMP